MLYYTSRVGGAYSGEKRREAANPANRAKFAANGSRTLPPDIDLPDVLETYVPAVVESVALVVHKRDTWFLAG